MNYKDILKQRTKFYRKIEDLKKERDFSEKRFDINREIEKEKFKYKFYNFLLKEENENKN